MDPSKYLKEDGRHVTEESVRKIMEKFNRIYGRGGIVSSEDNLCEKIMLYGIHSSLLKKRKNKIEMVIIKSINKILRPMGYCLNHNTNQFIKYST